MIFRSIDNAVVFVTSTTWLADNLYFFSGGGANKQFTVSIYDGSSTVYTFSSINGQLSLVLPSSSNLNPSIGVYAIPTWANGPRRVTLICSDWALITNLIFTNVRLAYDQALNAPFSKMTSLTGFTLRHTYQNKYTDINTGFLNLPVFSTIGFIGEPFTMGSRFFGVIPNDIFNPKLISLSWNGTGTINAATGKNKAYNVTNWSSINGTRLPLLETLIVEFNYSGGKDESDDGQGAFPDSWLTLSNLKTIQFGLSQVTSMPAKLNQLSISVTTINFIYNNAATSWANLSNLVNLTTIRLTGSNKMPSGIPSWFALLPKLKILSFTSVGTVGNTTDLNWQNNFYTSLYIFVTTYAPMNGVDSDPFRRLQVSTINADPANPNVGMQLVSGIKKAPEGYSKGVSNGLPATPAEMIFVLEDNYRALITYPS